MYTEQRGVVVGTTQQTDKKRQRVRARVHALTSIRNTTDLFGKRIECMCVCMYVRENVCMYVCMYVCMSINFNLVASAPLVPPAPTPRDPRPAYPHAAALCMLLSHYAPISYHYSLNPRRTLCVSCARPTRVPVLL